MTEDTRRLLDQLRASSALLSSLQEAAEVRFSLVNGDGNVDNDEDPDRDPEVVCCMCMYAYAHVLFATCKQVKKLQEEKRSACKRAEDLKAAHENARSEIAPLLDQLSVRINAATQEEAAKHDTQPQAAAMELRKRREMARIRKRIPGGLEEVYIVIVCVRKPYQMRTRESENMRTSSQIPREDLILGNVLAEGNFGKVWCTCMCACAHRVHSANYS